MFITRISLAPRKIAAAAVEKKPARIPKIPSRAPSAYNNFAAQRLTGKLGEVGSSTAQSNFSEKSKAVSAEWKAMSDAEKAKFAPTKEESSAAKEARKAWEASLTDAQKKTLRSEGKLKRKNTVDAAAHPWLSYLAQWRIDHPLPQGSGLEAYQQLTKECGEAYRKQKADKPASS